MSNMSNLQTYNPNSSNHDDYSIVVTVINSGYPDDPSLARFPQVSIAWNVSQSYCVNTGTDQATSTTAFKRNLFGFNKQSTGSKPKLPCPGAVCKVFRIDPSSPLRDNISAMLHDMYMIRFPLDNLRYYKLARGTVSKPLDSVDDMIGVIKRDIVEMLAGGRKKLQVNVRVEKQIRVSLEEYQARAARAELEDTIKDFFILMEHTRESAPDLTNGDSVIRQSKQIAVQFWEKLSSLAATVGLNINNTFFRGGNPDTLDLNQMQMQLALLMESLSLDFDAMMFKPTPASRGSVESLRKFWKIDGVDYGANSEYCIVCMDQMVSGIEVTSMPCEHMFHGDCIVQWLGLRHTCPVCRFELPIDYSKKSKVRS